MNACKIIPALYWRKKEFKLLKNVNPIQMDIELKYIIKTI